MICRSSKLSHEEIGRNVKLLPESDKELIIRQKKPHRLYHLSASHMQILRKLLQQPAATRRTRESISVCWYASYICLSWASWDGISLCNGGIFSVRISPIHILLYIRHITSSSNTKVSVATHSVIMESSLKMVAHLVHDWCYQCQSNSG
jgi:hypothetical protein